MHIFFKPESKKKPFTHIQFPVLRFFDFIFFYIGLMFDYALITSCNRKLEITILCVLEILNGTELSPIRNPIFDYSPRVSRYQMKKSNDIYIFAWFRFRYASCNYVIQLCCDKFRYATHTHQNKNRLMNDHIHFHTIATNFIDRIIWPCM